MQEWHSGGVIPHWRALDIQESDARAISELGDGVLMGRAAHGLAQWLVGRLSPNLNRRRIVLLVGPGNNGGDAMLAGVQLRRRGVEVTAVQCMPRLHESVSHLTAAGGSLLALSDGRAVGACAAADLIVDGVIGLGSRRDDLDLRIAELARRAETVAVDIPSGLHPDSGLSVNGALRADHTVSMGARKLGFLRGVGPELCGRIHDVPLGHHILGAPAASLAEASDAFSSFQPLDRHSHKYSRGSVGLIAGSERFPGAAILCAAGARAGGAGMVRVASVEAARSGAGRAAEAVIGMYPDVVKGITANRPVDALVVGPGVVRLPRSMRELVMGHKGALVLDAGALSLAGSLRDRRGVTCITPHEGELQRLVPDLDVAGDRMAAAAAAAERFGVVVVLKGAGTIVTAPGRAPIVDLSGGPELSCPGTGDALAGLIGSVLARHRPGSLEEASPHVLAAVLAHSCAGSFSVARRGPLGVRAGDVARDLPHAVRSLGVRRQDDPHA